MAHRPALPRPSVRRSANWKHLRLCLLLLLIISLLGPASAPAAEAALPRVVPQLLTQAAANPAQAFRVIILRATDDLSADAAVVQLGGTKLRDMSINAFVASVPGTALARLAQSWAISFIDYDATMRRMGDPIAADQLATVYPGAVNVPRLWDWWSGRGVGIAVLDTGITAQPDFNDELGTSRVVAAVNFNSSSDAPDDENGHGTHVAGIIAGNSWSAAASHASGRYVGIAPQAHLINVKVSDAQGMSYSSDVIDAIEWVIAQRHNYNIRVINLSLISSIAQSYKASTLAAAVERAWFNGIVVVVAAGNRGPDTMYYPPANDPFVITVGATDPKSTIPADDDTIAGWSSYGTTQDGYSKPDVVAPGRHIVSVLAGDDCTAAQSFPERRIDDYYFLMSGTSMSAPVVAGVAALALEAHPEWTNDQIKWLLRHTAQPLGDAAPLAGQGAGLVDASAVVEYAATPNFANQGQTISPLLRGPNGETTYDSADSTSSNWSTSNWSTSSESDSNWSTGTDPNSNWSTGADSD